MIGRSVLCAFRWASGSSAALCVGACIAACAKDRAPGPQPARARASAPPVADADLDSSETRACTRRLAALRREAALPGSVVNAGFARALLLGRARGEPVVFWRAPRFQPRDRSSAALALRRELERGEHPGYAFERILSKLRKNPELAREVFLTEGYLYTESPALAVLFVEQLALGVLFREPKLRLARGSEIWTLQRRDMDYEYQDGPQQGQRARLLLFDRVFVLGRDPGPALHLDARPLAARSLADEVRLDRFTESGALGALRFGETWLPGAFTRTGNALSLACQLVPAELRAAVGRATELARRRAQLVDVLSRVVREEVEEALPFDEPKTEEGQQDGQLRPAFRRAYLEGQDRYQFNDDVYSVFDGRGRARVPQVCIDFIIDTLERAGGTRFGKRGEPRAIARGLLNFDDFALDNRRSVESFLSFARAHPEWFEFSQSPPEQRVPFRERARFFSEIYAQRDEYRAFDIVTVFGLRNDEKLHYHSFFVVDRDPLTGMPIAVAANAGRPRIRSWENELQNAPRRAIWAHIRPKLPWLEAVVAPESSPSVGGATRRDGSPG